MVRHRGHVSTGRFQDRRCAGDERGPGAEADRFLAVHDEPGNLNTKGPLLSARGPVDQLEDRYLGMVEAVGSNPTRSTLREGASR